jgi:ubiquinone/menaquinone biosynthesis C-methylase UbiE
MKSIKSNTAVMARVDIEAPRGGPGLAFPSAVPLPRYLEQTYWWAYLHPQGVRFFERQWLVNLILWGNYRRLRDGALAAIGAQIEGKVLQVACVYGDFTERLARLLGPAGWLDVVDVAPVQLENLRRKIGARPRVELLHRDSANLGFRDAGYDCVVLFFLLHEQPDPVRTRTVEEALRVVRPGGKVVFVDYHRPSRGNPFRYLMQPVLALLEPYAMDLWNHEIASWLPAGVRPAAIEKRTYFGGLYQKVVITR